MPNLSEDETKVAFHLCSNLCLCLIQFRLFVRPCFNELLHIIPILLTKYKDITDGSRRLHRSISFLINQKRERERYTCTEREGEREREISYRKRFQEKYFELVCRMKLGNCEL